MAGFGRVCLHLAPNMVSGCGLPVPELFFVQSVPFQSVGPAGGTLHGHYSFCTPVPVLVHDRPAAYMLVTMGEESVEY